MARDEESLSSERPGVRVTFQADMPTYSPKLLVQVRAVCLAGILGAAAAAQFQTDPTWSQRVQQGKEHLERLTKDNAAPGCWAAAVADLREGCKGMDDSQRSKLAVKFTNCHLEKSGLDTYACTPDMSVEACTRPMVGSTHSVAYNAYTQFFTHAESMCFYLQSAAFQAATEQAVDALHTTARGTAHRLGELQQHASALIDDAKAIRADQVAASEAAAELLAGQRLASDELHSLSSRQTEAFMQAESNLANLGGQSQAALAELRRGTEEIGRKQGTLLGGLDRVLSLQGTVLGEFIDIKTLFFYTCAVLTCLAITATQRTASARLPVFMLLTLNLLVEKMLASYIFPPATQPERLHTWIVIVRRLVMVLVAWMLAHAALHHTDVGRYTISALDELKKMHKVATDEMQSRLERLEKEASAMRSRESSMLALQAAAMRKQNARRSMSPLVNPPSAHSSGGVRRAISPLVSGGSGKAARRHVRSPPSAKAAAPMAAEDIYPPSQAATDATGASEGITMATGGADVAAAMAPSVSKDNLTPAERRRRRSSIGSNETESLTPTRRSARVASRQRTAD